MVVFATFVAELKTKQSKRERAPTEASEMAGQLFRYTLYLSRAAQARRMSRSSKMSHLLLVADADNGTS